MNEEEMPKVKDFKVGDEVVFEDITPSKKELQDNFERENAGRLSGGRLEAGKDLFPDEEEEGRTERIEAKIIRELGQKGSGVFELEDEEGKRYIRSIKKFV
jgi:6-phosphogluconate dehydrogenase